MIDLNQFETPLPAAGGRLEARSAIAVFIAGDPKGQPRPKAFAFRGHARVYDPGTAEGWKSQVALALQPWVGQPAFRDAVHVEMEFRFRRPKSHYTTKGELTKSARCDHLARPDVDNCVKAILDAITTLGIWQDDDQIVSIVARKRYAHPNELPGASLEIRQKGR